MEGSTHFWEWKVGKLGTLWSKHSTCRLYISDKDGDLEVQDNQNCYDDLLDTDHVDNEEQGSIEQAILASNSTHGTPFTVCTWYPVPFRRWRGEKLLWSGRRKVCGLVPTPPVAKATLTSKLSACAASWKRRLPHERVQRYSFWSWIGILCLYENFKMDKWVGSASLSTILFCEINSWRSEMHSWWGEMTSTFPSFPVGPS